MAIESVDSSWTEPVIVDPSNPPKYPYNKIQQSESGHSIEMDDTVGKERLRLQHRSGSFLEMQPDGTEVHKIYGDGYEIVMGAKNVSIKGQCNITVEGPCVVNIKGDSIMNIAGDSTQFISGDVVQQIQGSAKITSVDDMDLTSKGDITMSAQNVNINADVNVRGGISCTASISATNNITAGKQSYAKLGFLTPGYITAGSPVPLSLIPGTITSTTYVQSKLANFGALNSLPAFGGTGLATATNIRSLTNVTDAVRSMAGDRAIFNMHAHSAVKGGGDTSGPTTIPE
jgi:hypothetical protein